MGGTGPELSQDFPRETPFSGTDDAQSDAQPDLAALVKVWPGLAADVRSRILELAGIDDARAQR